MRLRGWLGLLLLATAFSGCVSDAGDPDPDADAPRDLTVDDARSHPAFGYPAYRSPLDAARFPDAWIPPPKRDLPATLSGLEALKAVDGPAGGAGIAIFGHYAFLGQSGGGLWVVDIQDPADAKVVGENPEIPVRDADTIAYPDGTLILVTATGGSQFVISDVTDPTNPLMLQGVTTVNPNHNIAVVPGTPIVINSPTDVEANDIWDLTDPENPELVTDFQNGYGCHDVSFHIDRTEEKYRAYCAGREATQIWDITDPRDPSVIADIPFPTLGQEQTGGVSPATFSHLAIVNHDASVLIVGDETGGGAAPACDAYANAAGTTVSGPLGNLWFYDLSDETNAELVGRVSPPATSMSGSCTAHFGQVIEDTNHLVMAFYSAGVVLVDFTDPANPVIKDSYAPGGSAWDAWYYQGYVFTDDTGRGMDVLTFR